MSTVILLSKRLESIVHEINTRVKEDICRSIVLIEDVLSFCKLSVRKFKSDSDLRNQIIESLRKDCKSLIHYVNFLTEDYVERMTE